MAANQSGCQSQFHKFASLIGCHRGRLIDTAHSNELVVKLKKGRRVSIIYSQHCFFGLIAWRLKSIAYRLNSVEIQTLKELIYVRELTWISFEPGKWEMPSLFPTTLIWPITGVGFFRTARQRSTIHRVASLWLVRLNSAFWLFWNPTESMKILTLCPTYLFRGFGFLYYMV